MEQSKMVSLLEYKKSRNILTSSDEDFYDWQEDRKQSLEMFKALLKQFYIPYKTSRVVEIGKTKDNTIAGEFDTTIILSPFSETFDKKSPKNVFGGNLYLLDNKFFYGLDEPSEEVFNLLTKACYVLSHNPYTKENINNWELIPYFYRTLVLGVFGNKKDNDANDKMNLMMDMRSNLELHDFRIEDDIVTDEEHFACLITSKKKMLACQDYTGLNIRQ